MDTDPALCWVGRKSTPDGDTHLAGMTAAMIKNAAVCPHRSCDPAKDVEPITKLYSNPLVFAIHSSVKANGSAVPERSNDGT
jgi:hypothetical protein